MLEVCGGGCTRSTGLASQREAIRRDSCAWQHSWLSGLSSGAPFGITQLRVFRAEMGALQREALSLIRSANIPLLET